MRLFAITWDSQNIPKRNIALIRKRYGFFDRETIGDLSEIYLIYIETEFGGSNMTKASQ